MPVKDTDYNPKHSSLHSGILCSLVILTHLGKKLSMQIVPHKNLEKLWEHSRRKGWRCFFTSLFQLQLMETLSSWPKKRDLRAQWEASAVWEQVARRSTLSLSCSLCPSALPAQWLQSSAFPGALLCRIPSPVPCSCLLHPSPQWGNSFSFASSANCFSVPVNLFKPGHKHHRVPFLITTPSKS